MMEGEKIGSTKEEVSKEPEGFGGEREEEDVPLEVIALQKEIRLAGEELTRLLVLLGELKSRKSFFSLEKMRKLKEVRAQIEQARQKIRHAQNALNNWLVAKNTKW